MTVPVAMSKRKEKMLPLSSPAQRILPGASKERDSTRPVSLLEPPFTFFPVEMLTTCRWCLLFPTWNTGPGVKTFIISTGQQFWLRKLTFNLTVYTFMHDLVRGKRLPSGDHFHCMCHFLHILKNLKKNVLPCCYELRRGRKRLHEVSGVSFRKKI